MDHFDARVGGPVKTASAVLHPEHVGSSTTNGRAGSAASGATIVTWRADEDRFHHQLL
jgi:hypothetical protein